MQYEQLKPLVSRVAFIKTEKDDAKNFEVRQSSLQDAEEALWLAVEQQIDKADDYCRSLMESLEQQHEHVILEMSKVRRLQEFLIEHGFYAPQQVALSDIGERVVDGFYGPLTAASVGEYTDALSPAGPLPEASPDSLDVVADFCSTLDRVQEFVLINYVVISKVLQYNLKRAGMGTDFEKRLHEKLPNTMLFSTKRLVELMAKAEALVAGDVSVGKARVMEGDAWIKSRLVHSRILVMARHASSQVNIPVLPFLEVCTTTIIIIIIIDNNSPVLPFLEVCTLFQLPTRPLAPSFRLLAPYLPPPAPSA